MITRMKWALALAVLATCVLHSPAVAASKGATQIVVKGMHCQSCAKKLMAKLNAVPGVKSSRADAKKGIAVVVPKSASRLPSPRAQWEAVEKCGYKPVKLQGPLGTFTSKPKI